MLLSQQVQVVGSDPSTHMRSPLKSVRNRANPDAGESGGNFENNTFRPPTAPAWHQPRMRSVARTCGKTPSQGSSQRSRRVVGIPRTCARCVPRVQVSGHPLRSTCPEGRARRQCCRLRLPIEMSSARCSPETWAARDAARASSGRGSGELGAQLGLRLGLRLGFGGWPPREVVRFVGVLARDAALKARGCRCAPSICGREAIMVKAQLVR